MSIRFPTFLSERWGQRVREIQSCRIPPRPGRSVPSPQRSSVPFVVRYPRSTRQSVHDTGAWRRSALLLRSGVPNHKRGLTLCFLTSPARTRRDRAAPGSPFSPSKPHCMNDGGRIPPGDDSKSRVECSASQERLRHPRSGRWSVHVPAPGHAPQSGLHIGFVQPSVTA
jgi:hypothetical protein